MALWCQGFPIVTVPQSDQPKPITLIYPYYENRDFLRQQLGWWHTYPAHLRQHLGAIIVDDGSPEKPAEDVLKSYAQPFPIRLFRIIPDIRWNWLAARNIGAHYAKDGWCVLTDMDHVVPQSTAESLIYGKHDPSRVYAFSRIEHSGEPVAPHSASFFMTRQKFWEIGGYDERFSGFYGTDGSYRKRLARHAQIHVLTNRLVRHEYQGDSSTTHYLRKQPEDAYKPKVKGPPKVLSFPYHEVTL